MLILRKYGCVTMPQSRCAATTFDRYKAMLPRINAAIGHIRLDRLQPHHLLQFYDNLAETGVREDSKQRFKGDLKAMLRARSTTKTAFAAQAGVSLTVLNSITQGKNVSPESAARVSAALGQPVSALFDPVGEDRRLSAKTILHHHRLISVILQTAVEWQVLFSNPCDRVKPPRVEHKEARYLDEKQAMEVMQALEGEDIQNRTIIKVLLYTGMRRGELCGLTWADIDFEKSIIHIQRSSLYLADKGIFEDETKNATSRRSIKVPTDAMRALQLFQEWQDQQIYLLGDQWQASGRVFTSWNGAPIHPDTISGWFSHFIEKITCGYFAALAAAYQRNAADCGRHEPANRGCASGTFKHKYNGEDIRSCNTGSGILYLNGL